MIRLAWAIPFLILAGCAAYIARALRGHRRLACLRRAVLIRWLIGWTLACIAAVYLWRTIRHPLRYARYLTARFLRPCPQCYPSRCPRRDPDGEQLDRDEMRAFIGLVEIYRHDATPAERSRM